VPRFKADSANLTVLEGGVKSAMPLFLLSKMPSSRYPCPGPHFSRHQDNFRGLQEGQGLIPSKSLPPPSFRPALRTACGCKLIEVRDTKII
jgi:hypothetical protein